MNTQDLIDKLIKAISFKYKEDKTVPGLTIASLNSGFYCSIVRYNGSFGKEKKVVCKATGLTLDETLKTVASKFLGLNDQLPKDPIQELNSLIGTGFYHES